MIAIAYLATLLITVILIAVVFQRVLVKTLNRNINKDPKPISELGDALGQIFLDLGLLILAAVQFFQLIFSAVVFNIISNYKVYGLIVATCFVVEGNTSFQTQFYQTGDYISTNFGQPFYQAIVIVVANAIRAIWNIIIPWYNAVAYIQRFSYLEPLKVWAACSSMDWQALVNNFVTSLQAIFTSVGNFIGSQGGDDLNVSGPLGYWYMNFQILTNAWVCTCADFSFMTTIQAEILNLSSFHDVIDRGINIVIGLIRTFLQPCLQLITNGPNLFLCNEGNSTQILNCQLMRPPLFRREVTIRDQLMIRFFDMIDDIISIFFSVFFGLTPEEIPRFGPIISGAINGIAEIQYLVFNAIVHIDLVFGPTNFLKYSDLNAPLIEFYNISHGLVNFWGTWQQNFTDDIGGFQASLFNVSLDTLNFTMQFARELFTDTGNINNFLVTYDTSQFQTDLISAQDYAEALAQQINQQLGSLLKRLIYALQTFLNAFTYTLVHIEQFPGNTQDIINEFDIYFQALRAAAIQFGNCFRQYDQPLCTFVDPDALIPTQPTDELSFSCQWGNLMQSLFVVIIDFISTIADTIAGLIINGFTNEYMGFLIAHGPLNLGLTIIPEITLVVDAIAGIGSTPYYSIGFCPSAPNGVPNPPYTVIGNVRNVIFAVGNLTIGFLYDVNALIQTVGVWIAPDQFNPMPMSCPATGPLTVQEIMLCNMILAFYDTTVGNLGYLGVSIYDTGACVFGGIVSGPFSIAVTIWQDFGWDYPQSLRFQLCCILTEMVNAFSFFLGLFTGNATQVYNALVMFLQPIICPISLLITAIGEVVIDINLVPGAFLQVTNGIGTCISSIFSIIGPCIASCVSGHFNCDNCNAPSACYFSVTTFPAIATPDFASCPPIAKRHLESYSDPIWYFEITRNENGTSINLPDLYRNSTYWYNDPMNGTCGDLRNSIRAYELENKTKTLGIRLLLKNDLVMCYVSYRTAYLINTLFMAPNETFRIVDNDFLYDKMKFFHTIYNFLRGGYHIIGFQYYKLTGIDSNVTTHWNTYVVQNSLSHVAQRFGLIADFLLSSETRNGYKSPFSGIIHAYELIWRYTLGTWRNHQKNLLYISQQKRTILDKRFETWESTFYTFYDAFMNSDQIAPYRDDLNNGLQYYSTMGMNKWIEMNRRADSIPQVARNRYGAMLMAKRFSAIWNIFFGEGQREKRNSEERKIPMKGLVIRTNEIEIDRYPQVAKRQFPTPNFTDWQPCLVIDGVNLCFNCTVVNNIMDTLIQTLIEAYFESEAAINVQTSFFESETRYIQNEQNSMSLNLFGNTIPLHPHVWAGPGYVIRNGVRINVTNNSPYWDALNAFRDSYISSHTLEAFPIPNQNVGINFNRIIINILSWLSTVDLLNSLSVLFTFISNTNTSDPNGLFFWLFFLLNCEYNSEHLCNGNAIFPGLGLPTSIGVSVITLVTMAFAIEVVIGMGMTLAIVLLILFPILCITLAYGTSPFCMAVVIATSVPEIGYFPIILPIIPNCLANDLFVIFQYFNRDCIAVKFIVKID